MTTIVLLDSGPLGYVTYPKGSEENKRCYRWLMSLLSNGVRVCVPEIADYEVRRGFMRVGQSEGVKKLDNLKTSIEYIPLTTEMMLKAAEFWAQVRNQGYPTASDEALDGDVILAAQAVVFSARGDNVVIATTNVKHLALLVQAKLWQDIT